MITRIRKTELTRGRQNYFIGDVFASNIFSGSTGTIRVSNGETVENSLFCADFLAQILHMEEIDSFMFKLIDSELESEQFYEMQHNFAACDEVLIQEMDSMEPTVPTVSTKAVVVSVGWGEPDITEIDEIDAMLFDE